MDGYRQENLCCMITHHCHNKKGLSSFIINTFSEKQDVIDKGPCTHELSL